MQKKILVLKPLLFLFVFTFIAAAGQSQNTHCKNSICFDPFVKVAGTEIPVKGIDRLKYLMFDLYTAALYAPSDVHTINAILGNVPKSLILHYHHSIKKSVMIKASRDRIANNPDVDSKALEDRLKQLDAAYQNVQKNDRYELRYEPGSGTSLILNGKLQATIPGEDFQKAFFGIWLSRIPLNKKLRDSLLMSPQK